MSAGYASRLSEYPNKGVVGLPESFDSKRALNNKLNKFYELFLGANHVVVVTGAGISRAAGIPDFRGPTGIWTLEKEKKTTAKKERGMKSKKGQSRKRKHPESEAEVVMDFSKAMPTLTHRA